MAPTSFGPPYKAITPRDTKYMDGSMEGSWVPLLRTGSQMWGWIWRLLAFWTAIILHHSRRPTTATISVGTVGRGRDGSGSHLPRHNECKSAHLLATEDAMNACTSWYEGMNVCECACKWRRVRGYSMHQEATTSTNRKGQRVFSSDVVGECPIPG